MARSHIHLVDRLPEMGVDAHEDVAICVKSNKDLGDTNIIIVSLETAIKAVVGT